MKSSPILLLILSFTLAGTAISATIELNLQAGSTAASAALRLRDTGDRRAHASRESRRAAYLLAEANEAAARQQILSRLRAAKTPEEVDAATAELHDRWLAARDSILALKTAAEAEDAAPASSATD